MARKRRLSEHEEFEIMKLVMDKFLWIGTVLMGWGLYRSLAVDYTDGIWYILAGAMVMLALSWLVVKEFEQIR